MQIRSARCRRNAKTEKKSWIGPQRIANANQKMRNKSRCKDLDETKLECSKTGGGKRPKLKGMREGKFFWGGGLLGQGYGVVRNKGQERTCSETDFTEDLNRQGGTEEWIDDDKSLKDCREEIAVLRVRNMRRRGNQGRNQTHVLET